LHAGGSGVRGLSLDRRVCRPADGDPGVAAAQGTEEERPVRFGVHFWLTDGQGRVLLRTSTRPYKSLLGGMTELPGTEWRGVAVDCGAGVGGRASGSGLAWVGRFGTVLPISSW
jgi:hypothetical protein